MSVKSGFKENVVYADALRGFSLNLTFASDGGSFRLNLRSLCLCITKNLIPHSK